MLRPEQETSTIGWGVCVFFPYEEIDYCDGRMSLPLMLAMLVLGFVTFFVNLGVIIRTLKILRHGHDNKPAFYFIGNLALSDLAIGLYVVIAFLLHITKKSDLWQRSSCLLQIGVAVTACQETIFSIVLIAVDKYLYICHGLRYSLLVTTKRVYAALGISWFLSVLIGSLPALGMQVSWEEACNRCVFAQVVSKNFTIVFFVTSVVGPYAVVVSLYTVLLVLALKMHKSRYGGSYTADPSARSSNVRLSFISKRSKSAKSNVSTTVSSASTVSSAKANRRRTRRQEMAEQKARLPGAHDAVGAAKTRHASRESEDGQQPRPNVGRGSHVTDSLIQGELPQEGDTLVREGGAAGSPPASPDPHSEEETDPGLENITDGGDDGGQSDEDEAMNYTEGGRRTTSSSEGRRSHVSITTSDHPHDGQRDGAIINGVTDHTGTPSPGEDEQGLGTHNSLTQGKVDDHQQSLSKNIAALEAQAAGRAGRHQESQSDTNDDDLTADDTADEADLPPAARRTWLPAKYFNRVVADTRDKVLFLKKCRAVKTVLLIIVSFSATYVPFVVGTMVYSLEAEKQVCLLHMLSTLLYCAVVANSLANPLIYAYGYREFRVKTRKFKGIFAREKPRKVI
ncbi:uncharacterized protein [Panulirus ornatus]|uniref:uncharacterized protein isoform X2 n=1 Tax=Panulirus ornatus TaxID=150431 RepID=UPI003A83DFB5